MAASRQGMERAAGMRARAEGPSPFTNRILPRMGAKVTRSLLAAATQWGAHKACS